MIPNAESREPALMTFYSWKEPGVCAAGAAHIAWPGSHGLENAGSLCHAEAEL